MAANKEESFISFGEKIDRSLYEAELIEVAEKLCLQNKSVYDLKATKDGMSQENDKYVFITIYKGHASIVVVDKELFNTLLFEPVWGQLIDGPNIDFSQNSTVLKRMSTTIPLQQYHICLTETGNYILARNMYYFDWLMKSKNFFVGESALDYLSFQILSLAVLPSRYRLVADDCLEFAKRFAKEVAVRENGVRESEVRALYITLKVSEQYFIETLEQSSRNNPQSAFSVAVSYFMSFKPERLVVACVFAAIIGKMFWYPWRRDLLR